MKHIARRFWHVTLATGFFALWLPSTVLGHGNQSIDAYAPQGIGGSGPFPASKIDLGTHLSIPELGGVGSNIFGSDLWGWTDALTGREYAVFGRTNGTAFVDVTDPYNAVYLGNLPTRTGNSAWREMKVYQDHAYIVSDQNGPHGLQVFDLRQLRGVTSPQTFTATAVRDQFRNAHNVAINEESGYLYVVGSNLAAGGMYIYDIRTPNNPVPVGNFSSDGYTHDLQVVTYEGPDATYAGREIAFNSNEDTLTIVDVTNKSNPSQISRTGYSQSGYTHQGWLTEDQHYFIMDDEFDESNFAGPTRTLVWDVSNLDAPQYLGYHAGTQQTIDHNQFVKGNLVYQSNYTSGLRILKIDNAATADLTEVAYFDTYPNSNSRSFNGSWGNYPFFDSGTVIVADIQNGLFVLRPDFIDSDVNDDNQIGCADIDAITAEIAAGGNNPAYDLTEDGLVTHADRDAWLRDAGEDNLSAVKGYPMGDANLDGIVDGSDFGIWNAGKFTSVAAWCQGDFNADGSVDGSDYGLWNANKFTSAFSAATANGAISTHVPEPLASLMIGFGLLGIGLRRHLRRASRPS